MLFCISGKNEQEAKAWSITSWVLRGAGVDPGLSKGGFIQHNICCSVVYSRSKQVAKDALHGMMYLHSKLNWMLLVVSWVTSWKHRYLWVETKCKVWLVLGVHGQVQRIPLPNPPLWWGSSFWLTSWTCSTTPLSPTNTITVILSLSLVNHGLFWAVELMYTIGCECLLRPSNSECLLGMSLSVDSEQSFRTKVYSILMVLSQSACLVTI